MGRLRSKKFRAHAPAAQSSAATGKKSKATATSSAASAGNNAAAAAAAVAAAFAGEDDDELAPVDNEQSDDEEGAGEGAAGSMSRGQRKRLKRRSAFMRKMGLVSRVVQEKAKAQQKQELGVFADIQELQDALFVSDKELARKVSQSSNVEHKAAASSAVAASAKPKKLSGKQRQKLAVRELGQLMAVHTHPSFQSDPFAAIQMHLQNTVVQANEATLQKSAAASAGAADAGASKRSRAKGKQARTSQMDIE